MSLLFQNHMEAGGREGGLWRFFRVGYNKTGAKDRD
jgi:hypothetical protein